MGRRNLVGGTHPCSLTLHTHPGHEVGEGNVTLEIDDKVSRTLIARISMSLAQFAELTLSNLRRSDDQSSAVAEVGDPRVWGAVYKHEIREVWIPDTLGSSSTDTQQTIREACDALLGPGETCQYRDADNHHRRVKGGDIADDDPHLNDKGSYYQVSYSWYEKDGEPVDRDDLWTPPPREALTREELSDLRAVLVFVSGNSDTNGALGKTAKRLLDRVKSLT